MKLMWWSWYTDVMKSVYSLECNKDVLSCEFTSTNSHSCLHKLAIQVHPTVTLSTLCSYFVWPPSFLRTVLTLLGTDYIRVAQVATGILFYSMMTLHYFWMLETLCSSTYYLRMPRRRFNRFRSGDILASATPLPSASWKCAWGHCLVGKLPSFFASECHSSCWSSRFPLWMELPSAGSIHAALNRDATSIILD